MIHEKFTELNWLLSNFPVTTQVDTLFQAETSFSET